MPTVLVTGGAGFIGSNFVRNLLATDPDIRIINFDSLTYAGNLANLADVATNPRYAAPLCSIRVNAVPENPDGFTANVRATPPSCSRAYMVSAHRKRSGTWPNSASVNDTRRLSGPQRIISATMLNSGR